MIKRYIVVGFGFAMAAVAMACTSDVAPEEDDTDTFQSELGKAPSPKNNLCLCKDYYCDKYVGIGDGDRRYYRCVRNCCDALGCAPNRCSNP